MTLRGKKKKTQFLLIVSELSQDIYYERIGVCSEKEAKDHQNQKDQINTHESFKESVFRSLRFSPVNECFRDIDIEREKRERVLCECVCVEERGFLAPQSCSSLLRFLKDSVCGSYGLC